MTGRAQRVRVIRLGARRELTLVVGLGLVMMLVVGLGAAFASQSVAQNQALDDSERMTDRLAQLVIKPYLAGILAGDQARMAELQRTIEHRMSDGYLTEVTVWAADGKVLFSNNAEEIGKVVKPVPKDVGTAIRGRRTSAFEDDPPEASPSHAAGTANGSQPGENRYVEVYTPLVVEGYPKMAFEAYYNYERVEQVADGLLRQTLPIVLGPLLILQAIQIPVALSLARRLKRHEHDRSRLLERALSASDQERVRFAADLHDGPIQDLAGISYAMGAIAPTVAQQHAPLMARVQDALQRSIQSLRGLMTDLYPPNLRDGSLAEAIHGLADQVRAENLDVQLSLAEVPPMGEESLSTLYRVVRETLANVQKHAKANVVTITLDIVDSGRSTQPQIRLVVTDDGVGLEPSQVDRRAEGHLGLRLLTDRVQSLGGELVITSAPLQGTSVAVELPISPPDRI